MTEYRKIADGILDRQAAGALLRTLAETEAQSLDGVFFETDAETFAYHRKPSPPIPGIELIDDAAVERWNPETVLAYIEVDGRYFVGFATVLATDHEEDATSLGLDAADAIDALETLRHGIRSTF